MTILSKKKQKQFGILGLIYLYFSNEKKGLPRSKRWWVRDIFLKRKNHGAFHSLLEEMRLSDTEKYFNFLRITPNQFKLLLTLVGPEIEKIYYRREPISPAERLALTLRYLASGDSMVSLSYSFRLGKQTVSDIIKETCEALWNVLKTRVFMEPTEKNWLQYANEFEMLWQLPHCIGAIDGKHVVIQAPPNSGSQFYNYKGSHSIVLMALCDAKYKFIAIDIGAQGRQSDSGIFRNCAIGQRLHNNQLNLPQPTPLEDGGDMVPYYIVGDAAFPLSTNLMRPYAGNFLPLHKRIFNYRLCRGRRVSENTFGILVSRWRILRKPIIASMNTVECITKAVVVLHNWIMTQNDKLLKYCPLEYVDREDSSGKLIPGRWRDEPELNQVHRVGSNMYKRNAEIVRENLALHFCSEGAVSFQWDK